MSQFSVTSQRDQKYANSFKTLKLYGQEKVVLLDQCAELRCLSGFNIHVL